MSSRDKRPVWHVSLRKSYLPGQASRVPDMPRVVLRGTVDLPSLARWAAGRGTMFDARTLQLAAEYLIDATCEALVDGFAVDTPLGRLTPSVTGTWNPDRANPLARAANEATASFAPGPRLKEALKNPLFHEDLGRTQGPRVTDIFDLASGTHNERLTPGGYVYLRGRYLLMNGDLPQRGVELLDYDTGSLVHRFAPDDIAPLWNARNRLGLRLPDDLPAGTYRLAVTTQCTSGPTPLRQANRYVDDTPLQVVAAAGSD